MGGRQPIVLAIAKLGGRAECLLYDLQVRIRERYPNRGKATDPRGWREFSDGYLEIEGLTDAEVASLLESIDPYWRTQIEWLDRDAARSLQAYRHH
jgi:hypothetical protein